jgi:polar amino acid transport system substrate-binding protein
LEKSRAAALLFTVAVLAACAGAPTVPPAARSELAPTGKLRVALLSRNPVFVTRDGPARDMRGIAVDLGRELARQLGASFEPVRYDTVGKLIDGAKTNDWDVAFLGYEDERAAWMEFTAPYLELRSSYLVPAESPIESIDEVDRAGHRVGTSDRSTLERYLTRNLKRAQVVRLSSPATVDGAQLLRSGKLDVLSGTRLTLLQVARKLPNSRILDGHFAPVHHVLAVAKGRPAGVEYAKEFIEHAKTSGLVQRAIDHAGLPEVTVAPFAAGM